MGFQRRPCPDPWTCEYSTLQDKRESEDMINLKILRKRDYAGLCQWSQSNHKGTYIRKTGELEKTEKEMQW